MIWLQFLRRCWPDSILVSCEILSGRPIPHHGQRQVCALSAAETRPSPWSTLLFGRWGCGIGGIGGSRFKTICHFCVSFNLTAKFRWARRLRSGNPSRWLRSRPETGSPPNRPARPESDGAAPETGTLAGCTYRDRRIHVDCPRSGNVRCGSASRQGLGNTSTMWNSNSS